MAYQHPRPIQWLDVEPIHAPRVARPAIKTTNPLGHRYPHAKLRNVTLTPISRLRHNTDGLSRHLISSDDLRNFAITKADAVAKLLARKA